MRFHFFNSVLILLFSTLALFSEEVYAQQRQTAVESVSLGFSDACVSTSHNNFSVSFKVLAPLPTANNQYIIELSDAKGDFSSSTVLKKITDQNTSFEISTNVQLPNSVHGDAYKIRVSSTSPSNS